MASQYDIDIKIDVESASLGELETELGRLNDELKQIPRNTAEFDKAANSIKKVGGEVEKANSKLKAIDVGAVVGEFGKVAAGIGAAGLALSSFGADNEKTQEILEKTNAILALAATAEAVYTVTQKESQIAKLASAAATTVAATAQAAYTAVIGTSTGALKLFRLALVSTGIGAIVVGIGLLVANWDKLVKVVKESNVGLKEIGNILLFIAPPIGLLVKGIEALGEKLGGVQNILPAITGAFKAFFNNFKEIATNIGNLVVGIFTFDLDRIKEGLNGAKEVLVEGAREAIAEAEAERRKQQEIERRENIQSELDYQAELLAAQNASYEEQYQAKREALQNQLEVARLSLGEESEEYKDFYLQLLTLDRNYHKDIIAEQDAAAQDEIKLIRAKGQDSYKAELKALQDRLLLLKSFGDEFIEEIRKTEAQITVLEAQEEQRRKAARAAARRERLDRLKSELSEIAAIISADPAIGLQLLQDQQDRALGILAGFENKTRDINQVIKDLEKEGLTPLANQFRELADSGNYEDFEKLIRKYYGKQVQDTLDNTITSFFDLESELVSITDTAEDAFNKIGRTIKRVEEVDIKLPTGEIKKSLEEFEGTFNFTNAYNEINSQYDKLILEINKSASGALAELSRLFKDKLIDEEEYEKRVGQVVKRTKEAVESLNNELDSAFTQFISQQLTSVELINNKLIRETEESLVDLEGQYNGFKAFLASWSDDVVRDRIKADLKILDAQQDTLDAQRKALENAREAGLITERDYAVQLEAIDKQLFENRRKRRETEKELELQDLAEVLEVYEKLALTLQAASDLIGQNADLKNAKLDEAIAREEKGLELQLQGIDNEEERARVTAQAEEEITRLKNEQIINTAKAQKKQADLSMALAISEITVQTSLAIMKALADLGPIAGAAAAGLIAITGGLQIATAIKARNTAYAQADAALAGISSGGGEGGSRTQFADGGYVSGPGTGTSDSISARLSNGEYVVNAASTSAFLPLLEQINNTGRRFADGGMVSNGPDLSQILMRIEKRLATPPKAYVVSTEIQEGLDNDAYLQRRAQIT